MGYTVPTVDAIPDALVIGDYWQWRVNAISDFPATTWTLSYGFAGPATLASGTGWTITGEAAGTWLVQVAKATTAGYTAGRYRWSAYVTNGSERYQVASGWIVIQANFAALTSDNRTHAQKTYDLICAAIEGRIPVGEESYAIGGRSISKIPLMQLRQLRGLYAAEVYREQRQTEGIMSVGINFVDPSS